MSSNQELFKIGDRVHGKPESSLGEGEYIVSYAYPSGIYTILSPSGRLTVAWHSELELANAST